MIEPHSITDADKLACAERELALRKRVYPRFIDNRKMSAGKAALEIAIMEQIVEDYRTMVRDKTAPVHPLFGSELAPEWYLQFEQRVQAKNAESPVVTYSNVDHRVLEALGMEDF